MNRKRGIAIHVIYIAQLWNRNFDTHDFVKSVCNALQIRKELAVRWRAILNMDLNKPSPTCIIIIYVHIVCMYVYSTLPVLRVTVLFTVVSCTRGAPGVIKSSHMIVELGRCPLGEASCCFRFRFHCSHLVGWFPHRFLHLLNFTVNPLTYD